MFQFTYLVIKIIGCELYFELIRMSALVVSFVLGKIFVNYARNFRSLTSN